MTNTNGTEFLPSQQSQRSLLDPSDAMAPPSEVVKMLIGQAFGKLLIPDLDPTGKTVLVTGANTGLGFERVKNA